MLKKRKKMPLTPRFKNVSEEKANGATYTPEALADFTAEQIIRHADFSPLPQTLRILDPAVGDGVLLLSLIRAIHKRGIVRVEVFGFETNEQALENARRRISADFPDTVIDLRHQDFLNHLFDSPCTIVKGVERSPRIKRYQLIIANPPYVRTQILGAGIAQQLANRFGLTGRVDLYHAFMLGIAEVLEPNGTAGIIVSNRFMSTRAGETLRHELRCHFVLHHLWDLGDTKLFKAAVLPAVLISGGLSSRMLGSTGFSSIYECKAKATQHQTQGPLDALAMNGIVEVADGRQFLVQHGELSGSDDTRAVWRIKTDLDDDWHASVAAHSWGKFADIGKIRVGVKTCADKVFIRKDWSNMGLARPEILRPLTTHHIARRFRAREKDRLREILYPHTFDQGERRTIDIIAFPHSKRYLEQHRATLSARTYLTKAGRKWYELWVPQDPSLWAAPKLVFRDISEEPNFWIDLTGTVVNGDCYWLCCQYPKNQDLLWLALAVANSKFMLWYYDSRFNNKLYAGRRRFITQYVENFPLPDPNLAGSKHLIALAKKIYDTIETPYEPDHIELDRAVWQAFGLDGEDVLGRQLEPFHREISRL